MAAENEAVQHIANEAAGHAAEGASHPPELPNILEILHHYYAGNPVVDFMFEWRHPIFAIIAAIFIAVFFSFAVKKRALVPGRLQAFVELIIEALLGVIEGILGPKEARRYFPLLGSLFIFIFCMNWFGLVPLLLAPTASIFTTAALSISVFLFCQYNAFVRLGPGGYLYHLAGEPKDAIGWGLVPLFLPLHLLEELIKPLSLACRLFGNIMGEDTLLGVGLMLGVMLMSAFWHGAFFGIPFHFPFIFMSMLLGTIQALVFTLLAAVYISATIPHEHHAE